MGTSVREADERFDGVDDGLFEAAKNRMSGEEEEDHVEGHQVWSGPPLRGGWA